MERQKKKGSKTNAQGKTPAKVFTNRPFSGLKMDVAEPTQEQPPKRSAPDNSMGEPDEDDMLLRAMRGVQPLHGGPQLAAKAAEPKPMLAEQSDDFLVMKALDDLVHGETAFDFADTEEYIEACVQDFDHNLLRRLRRGELSTEAHLDLHGMNREQARVRVAEFVNHCHKTGKRCVLIIHGRGLGSKDNIPVLKLKLAAWLTRGAIGRKVLAYTSARPHDGGTGAVYVLLRG